MIEVLIADDHSIMRMGLAALVNSEPDMKIIAEAANGEEAVRLAAELRPDIVIMDLVMPRMGGAEATLRILASSPSTPPPLHPSTTSPLHPSLPRILILTTFGSSAEIAQAVKNGASGVLTKDTATDELVSAIRRIHEGGRVIPRRIERLIAAEDSSALSDRQLEILGFAARGYSNREIAEKLGISEIGVKKHFTAIFERLGASNRAEAISIAAHKNLLNQ